MRSPLFNVLPVVLSVILLVHAPASGRAETPPVITLEAAIEMATRNNLNYQAARAQKEISQAQITTAKARLNPMLVSDNGIAEKTYRLGLQQTLELGGKRKKRIAVAETQNQITETTTKARFLELRTGVRKAYTELYTAMERQKAYEDIVETTQRLLSIAQKRETMGDIPKVDVLGAQIAFANSKNDHQTAFYQVVSARNQLSALLFQPLTPEQLLAAPPSFAQEALLTVPPPKAGQPLQASLTESALNLSLLIEQALKIRPELQENRLNEVLTRQRLALAKSNRIPNLNLSAGPDLVAEPGQRRLNVYVIGALDIPVFNRQQGPIEEESARQRQLQLTQQALRNQITYEVINAHTAFIASQQRLKRYETELLPDAERIVKLAQLSFREGKSSILTPINAQQAFINTRLGYMQAIRDHQDAISDLEKAIGTGL
ncbi:TolC family protein [Vampirovibrio chlorellavorus]|uniref:TolC family protein n=1 Tax=Vampirovibrio chlorellavorus TaxID=758823 RepID=UPI0026E9CE83|nr:TolC family protein [Vampirovibrio chlorellavorus]